MRDFFWFILLTLLFMGQSSRATIVKLSDLSTMAKKSDIVVHGIVGEQVVATDELDRLVTLSQIEVIDGLYGAKTGDVVTFYQVGGEKDGRVMPLLGGQKYNVGQEVILFGLELNNAFVSFGAGQGKLDIIKDKNGDLVIEDLGDVMAIGAKNSPIFRPIPDTFTGTETLKSEIRQMIRSR